MSLKCEEKLDMVVDSLTSRLEGLVVSEDAFLFDEEDHESFDESTHWNKLVLAAQSVSKECTKIAVAYSKEPEPSEEEGELLLHDVELAVDVLLAWTQTFPISQGKLVHDTLWRHSSSIVDGVRDLLLSLKEKQCSEDQSRLQSTGTVWEKCEEMEKIPRDNLAAVLREAELTLAMVSDALEEIETGMADLEGEDEPDDPEMDDEWKVSDKKILLPAVGLMKACKGCMKMVLDGVSNNGSCSSPEKIKQLDEVGKLVLIISPCIDDFALSLYPPINSSKVKTEMEKVKNTVGGLIELLRVYFTAEGDSSRTDFIWTAVQHNSEKIHKAFAEALKS